MDLQEVGWGLELLCSEEGLCSMELVNLFVLWLFIYLIGYLFIYLVTHINSFFLPFYQ